MTEPIRRPLALPSEWKDQGIDYRRPAKDLTLTRIQPLDQHAVAIRYKRPRVAGPIIGLLVTIGVMFLLLYAMGPRFVADPSYRTFWNFVGFAVFVASLVLAVLVLATIVLRLVHKGRGEELIAVAPKGIYHRAAGWTAFFSWEDISHVRAYPSTPTQPTQRIFLHPWNVEKLFVDDYRAIKWPRIGVKSAENREIFGGELAVVDVAVPYWGLKFYHENPEYRRELGTEAGLRRFQRGDFPCDEEGDG